MLRVLPPWMAALQTPHSHPHTHIPGAELLKCRSSLKQYATAPKARPHHSANW